MTMKTIIYCDRCQTPVESSLFMVSMSKMTVIQESRCHGQRETTITRFEDIDRGTCNIIHTFQKDAREGGAMPITDLIGPIDIPIGTAEESGEEGDLISVRLSKPKPKSIPEASRDRLSFTTPKRERREGKEDTLSF